MPRRGGIRPDGTSWRDARRWARDFPAFTVTVVDVPKWWSVLTGDIVGCDDPLIQAARALVGDADVAAMALERCPPTKIGADLGWWPPGTRATVPYPQALAEATWPED